MIILLGDITDNIIKRVSGGVSSNDSKFSRLAIESEVPKWRAKSILDVYNGTREIAANKLINPDLLQKEKMTYNPLIQVDGADFVLFTGATPLQLNNEANGMIFVGDKLSGTTFTQLKSVGYYNDARDAGLISVDKVYYELSGNEFKVWGNTQVREVYKNFIASDPMEVPGFDPEVDFYPVSQDVLDILYKRAYIDLVPEASRPADKVNDSAETLERRAIKANII